MKKEKSVGKCSMPITKVVVFHALTSFKTLWYNENHYH